MSIGSIGSSFGTVSPASAVRETAQSSRAEEARESQASSDDRGGAETSSAPDASTRPTPPLSGGSASAVLTAQENARRLDAGTREAVRAYSAAAKS